MRAPDFIILTALVVCRECELAQCDRHSQHRNIASCAGRDNSPRALTEAGAWQC